MARHARDPLNLQNAERRDAIPLRQGLRGDAKASCEHFARFDGLDRPSKCIVFFGHAKSKATLES